MHGFSRDPNYFQAWLVGSGIASLTAALHLIKEAKVPGSNIHILDTHEGTGGGMRIQGRGTEDGGYFLPPGCVQHFHGASVKKLLSLIPSAADASKSVLDTLHESTEEPTSKKGTYAGGYMTSFEASAGSYVERLFSPSTARAAEGPSGRHPPGPLAQFVTAGESGPEASHQTGVHLGFQQRMMLIGFMLENESSIDNTSIKEIFDEDFFKTDFWMFWSTVFRLHPWHSAVEFQRHLRNHLGNLRSLNQIKELGRANFTYNIVESVIEPLTAFLKQEGVDFRFHQKVTDLKAYPESGPTTVSQIEVETEEGAQQLITLDPVDIIIVTLGSTAAGAAMGTNSSPPAGLQPNWENLMDGEWKLWRKLAERSSRFGNPANFLPRIQESAVETFTTTFADPGFAQLYENLTREKAGTGAFLNMCETNWGVVITVPQQPVFSAQAANTTVMLGYATNPGVEGNFVKKEMWQCTGEEILKEVLCHLGCCKGCDDDSIEAAAAASILATARTVPCGMPLGMAPLLTRGRGDRPAVIPKWTTNIACVGQFVEIPASTTLEIEYSVQSAQMAVAELMGLPVSPVKPHKSLLLEVMDLLT
ncbi:oleate hydratase [Aspergillus mulundensis]|uniref:Oleate hydratase n=1 Tax=Aspergillus mulundensis TaxID=1810919 RepID=A0A3D8R487_9EURO|nr:hypothetical protein DSM5745_08540 [Aspergillus mulundensis]RDW68780.1 hypothetical protein DSM5745_08540 [Aspergillus mulundensis]